MSTQQTHRAAGLRRIARRTAIATARLTPGWLRRRLPARLIEFGRSHVRPMDFYIDIVGTCNLRCPSCPVGHTGTDRETASSRMSLELFSRILDRIEDQYPGSNIGLFNWTEPFLHPQLATFIEAARTRGIPVSLSTNLNAVPNLEDVVKAGPNQIVISASGFTQPVYGIGHVNGQIERVKKNMSLLSELCARHGARIRVEAYYHKYRYNLHELEPFRAYAQSLGFKCREVWAIYQPLEAVVDYMDGRLPAPQVQFIESQYLLPIKDASAATLPYRHEPCGHPTRIIALDCRGDVQLCCGVYDTKKFAIGSFLELNRAEIFEMRVSHSYCGSCAKHGLHVYSLFQGHAVEPAFDRIAAANAERLNAQGRLPAGERG